MPLALTLCCSSPSPAEQRMQIPVMQVRNKLLRAVRNELLALCCGGAVLTPAAKSARLTGAMCLEAELQLVP